MNILVTGANGQLGTEIRNLSEGMGHHFIFSDVNEVPGCETVYLDITNLDAIRIVCRSENVHVIINCAAYTDVAKAEDDIDFAALLNHTAPGHLAQVAREIGATMIHISTDYVFHGDASIPYREDDEPHPLGVYGVTKLQGEEAVRQSGCKYLIFRTAWLYSPYGKNFVKTVRRLTAEKPEMKCVFDQVGTPTYAADLAALLVHIIRSGQLHKTGLYHYSDEGAISWFDFARAIRDLCGHSCTVEPCLSFEYPSKVRRPHYSVLDKTKVKKTFGVQIPYWLDSLRDCLRRMD
jgi:dTDP-4-dehydrorhamnose reductase